MERNGHRNSGTIAAVPTTSDEDCEEEEMHMERKMRWEPTYSQWDLVPAVANRVVKNESVDWDFLSRQSSQSIGVDCQLTQVG